MRKINILYVITSLGLGGAENLLLSHLTRLDRRKYNFFVCALREKPDDLLTEISKYAEVTTLAVKNKFNPGVILNLRKLIRRIHPDIIHTHLFQARIFTTFAHLLHKCGSLITHKHSIVNPKKHHIFMLLEIVAIMFNKKVIAISESVKHSLCKYEFIPQSKIFVLTNSIDYLKFHQAFRQRTYSIEKSIVIGTVGRVEKVKGINYLLMAMKIILKQYPNAKLEIVGDGSELEELKLLAKKMAISNSIIFFGKLENPIPNYSRMDIFVLPSLLEGFGLVLLEAMAAGIPVIATNVNGIKEVVINDESGVLIPPKNPEAIAKAVFKIIENPQFADYLVEQGLKRSKLFDIEEHVMKIENLYKNLLGVESYK